MKLVITILCSFILLSACNQNDFVEMLYFSRAKFVLEDTSGEKNIYMCKKGDSEKETQERAEKAHLFFQERLKQIVKNFMDKSEFTTKDKKLGIDVDGVDAAEQISIDSEKMMEDLEAQFQCMFIGKVPPKD